MTIQDIINSINNKVENALYARFTLARVIDELNNTYRDLANKTDVFETFDYLQLVDGQIIYTLPGKIRRPTRAVFRGQKVDFKSQEAMDVTMPTWEAESAESQLCTLVYNNLSDRRIKAYPRLTDMTVTVSQSSIIYLGVVDNPTDVVNTHLHMDTITGAKYLAPASDSLVDDMIEVVTVYGAYLPPLITEDDLDSTVIYVDEMQVNALIYGTAGNLLFTIGRTEDTNKGTNYLRLYGVDETEVGALRSDDFTGKVRNTSRQYYRTPFQE